MQTLLVSFYGVYDQGTNLWLTTNVWLDHSSNLTSPPYSSDLFVHSPTPPLGAANSLVSRVHLPCQQFPDKTALSHSPFSSCRPSALSSRADIVGVGLHPESFALSLVLNMPCSLGGKRPCWAMRPSM